MAKFEVLSEDHNDIFAGTPKSKFWDIANQADKELVEDEFDKILTKLAILEMMIEDKNIGMDISEFELKNSIEIEDCKKSLYMNLTTNIVSKLEQ